MSELKKILWISFFESKTIIRSKIFKVFFIIQILLFLLISYFVNLNLLFHSVSSATPYIYILFLNFIQAISIIFITAHIFSKDRKHNTTLALYPRSFSNVEYILGKALGIFEVFVSVSLLFTVFVFLLHFFLMDTPVKYFCYLIYPLLIFLPTILFTIGLTAFITILIKSEIITITLLMLLFMLVFPAVGSQFPYLFDFTGKNLPMFFSDFIGFGNLPLLFLQRGVYVFAGIGFVFLSGILFRFYRLPQSILMNILSFSMVLICIIVSSVMAHKYLGIQYAGKEMRNSMRALEKSITNQSYLSMRTCDIDLIHKKDIIEVKATITFENTSPEAAGTYSFRLNPGLEVLSVENRGKTIKFERNIHILTITPSLPLSPGEKDSLTINYKGRIDENACYIDIDKKELERNNSTLFLVIDKRYSFITPEYVLLTQENLWYPKPFTEKSSNIFKSETRDFTKFKLNVTTSNSLTAISQGKSVKNSPGKFTFIPEQPLTQISLAIGDYEKHTTVVDSIEYTFYAKKGHNFTEGLEKLNIKKIHEAITDSKREYELDMANEYPFKRFSIIETPVQFLAHSREWNFSPENVQPEEILFVEKGIVFEGHSNQSVSFKKQSEYMRYSGFFNTFKTDEEIQYYIFRSFMRDIFLRETMERKAIGLKKMIIKKEGLIGGWFWSGHMFSFIYDYNISPNYYCFTNSFSSDKYPLFDLAVAYYVKSKELRREFGGGEKFKALPMDDMVKKILKRYTLNELMNKPEYRYMLYYVLRLKSVTVFATIKARTGLKDKEFDAFLADYLKSHRFENVPAENFFDMLSQLQKSNRHYYNIKKVKKEPEP